MRHVSRCTIRLLLMLVMACLQAAEPAQGYSCLFMGHSFFAPMANSLPALTRAAGLVGHQQTVVFHAGKNGAPGMLWKSDHEDVAKAKALLATGTVDLLGLTFYTDVGSDVGDYRTWMDLALQHNPKTRFFIMSPWCINNGKTFAQYKADTDRILTAVHGRIDDLRQAYPTTTIFCIPQGRWMVELWRRYDAQMLPEVVDLIRSKHGKADTALFNDAFGHGGSLAVQTGALLWLATIYGVDLPNLAYDTRTKADLKTLAQQIILADDYARNEGRK